MSKPKQRTLSSHDTSSVTDVGLLRLPQPLIATSYRKRRARAERFITTTFDPALSLKIDQALVNEEFFARGTHDH